MKHILFLLSMIILITGCSTKEYSSIVTTGEKDGLIDDNGELLIKPIYKKMYYLDNLHSNAYAHPHLVNMHWFHVADEKFAIVKNVDNKYGIIKKDGTLALKAIFDSIGQFFNGYAKIEVDKKFGLIDEDFKVVLKPIYDEVRNLLDDSIIVKNYDKNKRTQYGCLDREMNLKITLDYDMVYLSSENRMRTEKDGLWGFISSDCKIVSKPIYNYADDYSKSIARVKKGDLWTYLNYDGQEITRKTFSNADNF